MYCAQACVSRPETCGSRTLDSTNIATLCLGSVEHFSEFEYCGQGKSEFVIRTWKRVRPKAVVVPRLYTGKVPECEPAELLVRD